MQPTAPAGPAVLVLGAVFTGFGALGLLVLTGASAVLAGGILVAPGEDRSGDALAPALGAGVFAVALAMLVVTLVLLLTGRDAGRSASAWIGGSLPVPMAIAVFAFGAALSSTDDRIPALATPALLGMGGGLAAIAGFVVGAAMLGSAAARRYTATRLPADPAPTTPPRSLRTALRCLAAAYGLALVGLAVFLASARLSGADGTASTDRVVFLVVFGVMALILAVTGLAVIGGAAAAGSGRRGGASLARVGAAVALPVLWLLLFMVAAPAIALADSYTTSVDVSVAIGLFNALLVIGAIVAMVIGLAALADPRSERHFTAARRYR